MEARPRDETIVHMAAIQGGHNIFKKDSVVGGNHIYKENCTPVIGKERMLMPGDDNEQDTHG